jgi:hypothetical protein
MPAGRKLLRAREPRETPRGFVLRFAGSIVIMERAIQVRIRGEESQRLGITQGSESSS